MIKPLNSCSKRTFRDRYYSSMDYQEFYLLFGPPTPLVKPLDDPTQDIPELCLEYCSDIPQKYLPYNSQFIYNEFQTPDQNKDRNQNDAPSSDQQKLKSQQKSYLHSTNKTFSRAKQLQLSPKQKFVRQRPRSKSDNSDYLIFSFLQKINKKGQKKTKLQ